MARLQTREQRLRRYQELIGKDNYDDEINDAQQAKGILYAILHTLNKYNY